MAKKEKKPELKEYADRIKEFIRALNIEQKDLANSASLREPTVSAYIKQESQPSMSTLSKWVRKFNINGHWLLTGEGEMIATDSVGTENEENDPIVKRMREANRILKDAPPEVLYEVIKNITQGQAEMGKTQSTKKAS